MYVWVRTWRCVVHEGFYVGLMIVVCDGQIDGGKMDGGEKGRMRQGVCYMQMSEK